MNCYNCNVKLLKREELCKDCKFNDEVTISKTNVKKLYKLTDNDLNDPDLYYFTFSIMHGYGTRYMIEDIEDLVEEITDCEITDKRYIALTKIREKRDKKINDIKIMDEKIQVVKDLLRTMIEKEDLNQYIDQMKFLIDNDFYLDIKNYDIDDKEIYEKLLDVIENKAKKVFELNQLIKNHYKEEYDKYIKVLRSDSLIYKECMDKYLNRDQEYLIKRLFNELDKDLTTKETNHRMNQIETLLVEKNKDICKNENFYECIRMTAGYKKYIEGSVAETEIDDSVKKIGKTVRTKIEKQERKLAIDEKLGDHINNPLIDSLDAYNRYINHGILNIDDAFKNIMSELVEKTMLEEQRQIQAAILKKERQDEQARRTLLNKQRKQQHLLSKKQCKNQQQVVLPHNRSAMDRVVERLGKDVESLRDIMSDFEKHPDNELLLQDFHGDELIFFNLLCEVKGFTYRRLNYSNVSIKKINDE